MLHRRQAAALPAGAAGFPWRAARCFFLTLKAFCLATQTPEPGRSFAVDSMLCFCHRLQPYWELQRRSPPHQQRRRSLRQPQQQRGSGWGGRRIWQRQQRPQRCQRQRRQRRQQWRQWRRGRGVGEQPGAARPWVSIPRGRVWLWPFLYFATTLRASLPQLCAHVCSFYATASAAGLQRFEAALRCCRVGGRRGGHVTMLPQQCLPGNSCSCASFSLPKPYAVLPVLQVLVVPLPLKPLFPGGIMPVTVTNNKLIKELFEIRKSG